MHVRADRADGRVRKHGRCARWPRLKMIAATWPHGISTRTTVRSADSYLEDRRHVGEIDVRAAACRRARARRSGAARVRVTCVSVNASRGHTRARGTRCAQHATRSTPGIKGTARAPIVVALAEIKLVCERHRAAMPINIFIRTACYSNGIQMESRRSLPWNPSRVDAALINFPTSIGRSMSQASDFSRHARLIDSASARDRRSEDALLCYYI